MFDFVTFDKFNPFTVTGF